MTRSSQASNNTWTGLCSATTLTTPAHVAPMSTSVDIGLKRPTSRRFSPAAISAPVVIACEGRPCSAPGRSPVGLRKPPSSTSANRASWATEARWSLAGARC